MFNLFKRKPDPRIAELESQLEQWKDNANLYRQERDLWHERYLLREDDYESACKRIRNLLHQAANHRAATLYWVWEEFSDGSGNWIYLEQDDRYEIDPESISGKFLAYSPMSFVNGYGASYTCKTFDTQFEAKAYLETLYLKSLQ